MKALHQKWILPAAIAGMMAVSSCVKDTATKKYTTYVPVYSSPAQVRANIKSGPATIIENPGKVFLYGNYIFLNEVDKGVHIIDNSNPSFPVNKHFISIPGNQDLAVKGNMLYADLYQDLVAIDISNPAAAKVKKVEEKAFPRRLYLNGFVGDSTKIITGWIKKDTTVATNADEIFNNRGLIWLASMASPASASVISKGISGSMARFTLLNNYLYTVTNSNLHVFNVSQPENPVFTSTKAIGWNVETIYPFKNNLFVGSSTGMFMFSATNAAQPQLLSQFAHLTSCDPVIADDNYAYVTLRTGTACNGVNRLDVLDIRDMQDPQLIKSYPFTHPHGLSKDGDLLFICDGVGGLKVLNASNVNSLTLVKSFSNLNSYDVITYNGNAVVVANNGLYQVDYTNRNDIHLRSTLNYK